MKRRRLTFKKECGQDMVPVVAAVGEGFRKKVRS
jgi:hypothetical protein